MEPMEYAAFVKRTSAPTIEEQAQHAAMQALAMAREAQQRPRVKTSAPRTPAPRVAADAPMSHEQYARDHPASLGLVPTTVTREGNAIVHIYRHLASSMTPAEQAALSGLRRKVIERAALFTK